MKRYYNILGIVTIAFFLGAMLTPMLNSQLGLINEISGNENRAKAAKPVFDLNNLDDFTKDYDTYYTDNFNLRQNFISLINRFDYTFFKISPVPHRVTVGKDGWFYATKSADYYKGANLFSNAQMHQLKVELENRTKWAESMGTAYYLVIVPNKMNIYPEHLPQHIISISDSTRYDQVAALDQQSDINVIDLKKYILPHKEGEYDIYQHTDDHWNDLGAYYGYQAIMNRLSEKFPELKPFPLTDYKIESVTKEGGLAKLVNAEKDYPENYIELIDLKPTYGIDGEKKGYLNEQEMRNTEREIVKINNSGPQLKCLIIRDSFTIALMRFFQEQFKRTVFIHDDWTYQMHTDIVESEKPDIVLVIILETELHKLLSNNFPPTVFTVDMFLTQLTTDPEKIEKMRKLAISRNLTNDEMTKLTALWLFEDRSGKGEKVRETLKYYELLFEVDSDFKKQTTLLAEKENMSFNEAVKLLAKEAFEKKGKQ